MKYQRKIEIDYYCPFEYGLDIFGGRWKSRIICVLSVNPILRYNELKRELNNITDAVLASMLKELIVDDIITRYQYNEIPPRVEYELTEKGHSILPILKSICSWSQKNTKSRLNKKLSPCKVCPLR
jgi:DNA-binding HxlR family transcriptional regulator